MKKQGKLPTSEEFLAFWQGQDVVSWRTLRPYVLYISGFALYAVIVRAVADVLPSRCWLAYLAFAVAYIVLLPYLWVQIVWKRYARFIGVRNAATGWVETQPGHGVAPTRNGNRSVRQASVVNAVSDC